MVKKDPLKKRAVVASAMLGVIALYAIAGLCRASFSTEYLETVENQSSYSMTLAKARGIIYDCNGERLTNTDNSILAVCMPTQSAFTTLKDISHVDGEALMKAGLPFTAEVTKQVETSDISCFQISRRYSSHQLCQNLIGYTDGGNHGVCGIEKAFDEKLSSPKGEISIDYKGDALGRAIVGDDKTIHDSYSETNSGIRLTIDSRIQKIAESACVSMDSGAVIVMDAKTSKIKAMVSKPGYSPEDIENVLSSDSSPLINRALSAYAPGSVFKLLIAETALESGTDCRNRYLCTGHTNSDGLDFSCFGGSAHGPVNLHTALQKSCNCYFIELGKKLDPKELIKQASEAGFGIPTDICSGISGDKGSIGTAQSISLPRDVSNFSIGQGNVTVTPVQMAAYIGAIANNGIYTKPTVYEGDVNEEGSFTQSPESPDSLRIMEVSTARQLKNYMRSVVKYGTGYAALSDDYKAGAKTGTAETGIYENRTRLINSWFCGFTGEDDDYVIAVLCDGCTDKNNVSAEVFSRIAAKLALDNFGN